MTYFQLRDCEQDVLRNGLDYAPIVEKDFPRGTLPTIYAELGACEGTSAIKYVIRWFSREARAVMAEAPDAVRSAGIDLLLVDQTTPGPAIVAEYLGIPLVLVSNALLLNREADHSALLHALGLLDEPDRAGPQPAGVCRASIAWHSRTWTP